MASKNYVTWYLVSLDNTSEFFIAKNGAELDRIVEQIMTHYPGSHTRIRIRVDRHSVPNGPLR